MEDNELVLRTENLVKKYGKRTVVDHVSFDVKQGEIVGLLGPNGAGKTTSFYMTTGLIVPNGGVARSVRRRRWRGLPWRSLSPSSGRRVCMRCGAQRRGG